MEMELEKEVKKLIKEGFRLDFISLEFDIPFEQVEQWKKELETPKKQPKQVVGQPNFIQVPSKMKRIRERYNALYLGENNTDTKSKMTLSEKEIEEIKLAIATIEQQLAELEKATSYGEKKQAANTIWDQISLIKQYGQLPVDEAIKFHAIVNSNQIRALRDAFKWFNANMINSRVQAAGWLSEAISVRKDETDDIEELESLKKMITPEMERSNKITIGTIKNQIERKISSIKQKNAIDRIKNDIPESIVKIIHDLASGEIDMQAANEIIDEEARRRVSSNPQNRFSLTQEQQRKQIIMQIRTAIMERPDRYHIKEPGAVALRIQQLSGGEINESRRVVVKNLIGAKRFALAKIVCNQFSEQRVEGQNMNYIFRLREEIRNAEIGDLVFQAINMRGTTEEENAYFTSIDYSLQKYNVSPSSISLGKSKDGLRNITLADIWTDGGKGKSRG